MLILPLHRPITRATFPIAAMLLVLLNVLVFFGGQSGDAAAMEQARRHYVQSGLGDYELPAYERYLRDSTQPQVLQELHAVPQEQRADYVGVRTMTDVAFAAALHRGRLFDSPGTFAEWKPLRAEYEALQAEVFTLRHLLRSSEVDPWRMLVSAFLHADFMHLLGNMVFLVAIGLLVEGAVGSWRFIGVYVVGAFGASAASLLWRWGEAGGGLGASGAVAALMGAFCVVWGRQPVRFFYWFGVVFDYVRAPAIWLFPLWLGWELYQLLAADELGIGFDAHAGGLVTGALLGAVLARTGQVRQDFIDDAPMVEDFDARLQQALQHLGKLQLVQAEALLESLAREQPCRADVQLARYRAARLAGNRALQLQRGRALLERPADSAAHVQAQHEAWLDLRGAAPDETPGAERTAVLLRRWLALGETGAVESLLDAVDGQEPVQAQLWFELALCHRDRLARDAQLRVLHELLARHPAQPQAAKARFLLDNA